MGAYAEAYLSDVVENQESYSIMLRKHSQIRTQRILSIFICRVIHGKASMNHRHM